MYYVHAHDDQPSTLAVAASALKASKDLVEVFLHTGQAKLPTNPNIEIC